MTFSPSQVRKLRSPVRSEHVKTRVSDGQTLSYLEGWQVIAQCNRIFGFDSWNRETASLNCLNARPQGNRFAVSYLARVRITVRAGGDLIIREGSGVGHAQAATLGQAHEIAAKGAETDATKRALATFGAPFGLTLYGGHTEFNSSGKANGNATDTCGPNGSNSTAQRAPGEERAMRALAQVDPNDKFG